jgi:hypothetical protein
MDRYLEGKQYVALQPRIRVCVLWWEETWRLGCDVSTAVVF